MVAVEKDVDGRQAVARPQRPVRVGVKGVMGLSKDGAESILNLLVK
jgi:hypothetical protein